MHDEGLGLSPAKDPAEAGANKHKSAVVLLIVVVALNSMVGSYEFVLARQASPSPCTSSHKALYETRSSQDEPHSGASSDSFVVGTYWSIFTIQYSYYA